MGGAQEMGHVLKGLFGQPDQAFRLNHQHVFVFKRFDPYMILGQQTVSGRIISEIKHVLVLKGIHGLFPVVLCLFLMKKSSNPYARPGNRPQNRDGWALYHVLFKSGAAKEWGGRALKVE
jgi:hypothetical protein